jgi:hypothetical protein
MHNFKKTIKADKRPLFCATCYWRPMLEMVIVAGLVVSILLTAWALDVTVVSILKTHAIEGLVCANGASV